MSPHKIAAACMILTLASAAAAKKPARHPASFAGTVVKATSKIAPGADGRPLFREGRMTMVDNKAEHSEELKATPRTKITLDGKDAQFKAATPGTLILRALYDPKTKELSALDLKSAPRPPAQIGTTPGLVTGEIANTDILKGTLSVRTGPHNVREFAVTDQTSIEAKNGSVLAFEALNVGDPVEVDSKDGKSAASVHVRAAP